MVFGLFRSRRLTRPAASFSSPRLEVLEDRTVPSTLQGDIAHYLNQQGRAGVFDPSTATFFLRNSNSPGAPNVGQFQFGAPGWIGLSGDWSGSGKSGIGVFDPTTATWYLRNETSAGAADAGAFQFGMPGWIPVVGDWSGTGKTGIGVYDPTTGTFYLRNSPTPGAPDAGQFAYGAPGWRPIAGDWTGTGKTGIGVYDPSSSTFYLRNELSAGAADAGQFTYGAPGWVPLAGDWNGSGHSSIGVYNPGTGTFYLRNELSAGAADAGQFTYGAPNWQPVVGNYFNLVPLSSNPAVTASTNPAGTILTLTLNPLDINLLGLEVQTNQITVTVSAQPGNGQLLGNLLTTVTNLLNLQATNNALNNVLGGVVQLLNSTSLTLNNVDTSSGPLSTPTATGSVPVLDAFIAPVHLNLLGALVDTSPIHLTIKANTGPGMVLGNVVADLANLFNPPLPGSLSLDYINNQLQQLLNELTAQLPGIQTPAPPTVSLATGANSQQILSLTLAPINLNLLGLVLQTSQIQVNANALTGAGDLLGNVLTDLLNTAGATPQSLNTLNNNLNALLGKVVGILNDASLVLPSGAVSTLSTVLQELALPGLVSSPGANTAAPILNLSVASSDPNSPPVDVNLLGVVVTTSNIQVQLLAQPGDGQVLGNLLYNVANLLNPGGSINLLTILQQLGL